ncbi:MAG: hypothetical protein U9R68_03845 [Planctomycetota bacterium]|nr:hypothetical protein [Planctomycetota bacterium]
MGPLSQTSAITASLPAAADSSVAPAVWPPPAPDGGSDAETALDPADVLAGPALDGVL